MNLVEIYSLTSDKDWKGSTPVMVPYLKFSKEIIHPITGTRGAAFRCVLAGCFFQLGVAVPATAPGARLHADSSALSAPVNLTHSLPTDPAIVGLYC